MKLSDGEKLILMMLSDLHKSLRVQGEVDPDFVQAAILDDALWGISWKYPGVFNEGVTPPEVKEVCDFLDMWQCLELSWKELSAIEKVQVGHNLGEPTPVVSFIGFDGNYEGDYVQAMRFLVEHLERYAHFRGRSNLDSHSPTLSIHRRMSDRFKKISVRASGALMPAKQLGELLQAE